MVEDRSKKSHNRESYDLLQLRNTVRNYVSNHMYNSALFWSTKICTLSNYQESDVVWYANVLYLTKQYLRAANVLTAAPTAQTSTPVTSKGRKTTGAATETTNLTRTNLQARYLAAQCYFECRDWRRSLEIIESEENEPYTATRTIIKNTFTFDSPSTNHLKESRQIESALALLRGKIYRALGNGDIATLCFKEALQIDVYCFEAFHHLVWGHALKTQDEVELINNLPYTQQCNSEEDIALLKYAYESQVNQYGKHKTMGLPATLQSLERDLDATVTRAANYFNAYNYREAFRCTSFVIKQDSLHENGLLLHLSCLVQLRKKTELFNLAQKYVNIYPTKAVSWYSVGAYYLLLSKGEPARKYFSKATTLDPTFGLAMLGFAHSLSVDGERDQAISAYYSAVKMMPGAHLPLLCLGMEYTTTNNLQLASSFFKDALAIGSADPQVRLELGVLAYINEEYAQAEAYLLSARRQIEETSGFKAAGIWYPLYTNLGHTCRKQGKYDDALAYHEQALLYRPNSAAVYTALALCRLLKGEDERAISLLHRSLSINKNDTITVQLLQIAVQSLAESGEITSSFSTDVTADTTAIDVSTVTQSTCSSIDLTCDSNLARAHEPGVGNEIEIVIVDMGEAGDSSSMSIEDTGEDSMICSGWVHC